MFVCVLLYLGFMNIFLQCLFKNVNENMHAFFQPKNIICFI